MKDMDLFKFVQRVMKVTRGLEQLSVLQAERAGVVQPGEGSGHTLGPLPVPKGAA